MDRPFLRLAPFKVEIMRFNPLAVMFRNIISDEEIEVVQSLARPKVVFTLLRLRSSVSKKLSKNVTLPDFQ